MEYAPGPAAFPGNIGSRAPTTHAGEGWTVLAAVVGVLRIDPPGSARARPAQALRLCRLRSAAPPSRYHSGGGFGDVDTHRFATKFGSLVVLTA
ncbi:hypothetical protein GA0070624_3223 [Micromonospora rhizosphaerae]|uniref:Uncharacterized protein n=1 Tax=Micromonospora rhizosphaerae TaxID=568872 RepID=A0A1C6S997_9ACTN|nr:hypothetical protein [Micromonospora rhizosphaerae]SCL26029.1 hypothetical protein GA0070624_3223 [Micromonospora rhizosphaerae]